MRAKLAWAFLWWPPFWPSRGVPASGRGPRPIRHLRDPSGEHRAVTRLTVECTGPVAYTDYSPDPLTLVVDIPEVDASKVPARINVGTREVESLRVTTLARADGRNLARLEVRLASLVPYKIFSKDKTLNLVFERAARPRHADRPRPPRRPAAPLRRRLRRAVDGRRPRPRARPAAAEPRRLPPRPTVRGATARATRILAVSQQPDAGQLAVTVQGRRRLRYQDFFLGNPDRLVIDFKDVVSRRARGPGRDQGRCEGPRSASSAPPPRRWRAWCSTCPRRAPYRIVEGARRRQDPVRRGRGTQPGPPGRLRAPEPDPCAACPSRSPLPAPAAGPRHAVPCLRRPQLDPGAPGVLRARKTLGPAARRSTPGPPISLDFKDGDLQDIFRLFADISGLNVVVNPGVSGKVTLKLTEVPWDQALDLILKTNGLGKTLDDNVIRIARLADLQKEEEDLRKLKERQALAGDLSA